MSSSVSSLRSKTASEGGSDAPVVELRASVLEAAISLGFRNSVMKKWMFDPVQEGEEEEPPEHTSSTPALTSPSTSEESAMSPYSFLQFPGKSGSGSGPGSGSGSTEPFFRNNNVDISRAGLSHEGDAAGDMKGSYGKLTLAVPPTRNKLRKQRAALTGGIGDGYESDGGYVPDFTKKPSNANGNGNAKAKSKMNIGWGMSLRGKDADGAGADDDGESDGGYRSEAVSGVSKAKRKVKDKNKELNFLKDRHPPSPPPPPTGLDDRDPGALLATIKASILPDSKPSSGSTPEFSRGPGSSSGHGHGPLALDGYVTDSGSAEKRGRTKKKTKTGRTKSKSRAASPSSTEDASHSNTPTKKKSLFRFIGRSASRDAKDRDHPRVEEEPPPLPEFRPPLPLPIADRFARSGAGTPVGNASSSASPTASKPELGFASRVGAGLTTSASSLDIQLRSSGSIDTLVPPTLHDPARSDSPWSYRSAPGRIGVGSDRVMTSERTTGSGSLELPRERKDSGNMTPFSMMQWPEDGASAANGGKEKERSQSDHGHPLSRSMSPIVITGPSVNANNSPDLGRSPTTRIGKLFAGFGNSSSNTNGDLNGNGISNLSTAPTSSKPTISLPNPHLKRGGSLRIPNPLELAAALTNSAKGTNGNGNGNASAKNLSEARPVTPESFIIIDEDEGVPTPIRQQRFGDTTATVNTNEPSTSPSTLAPAATYGPSATPASPTTAGLAVRRRALLQGLGLDVTPMQSRSITPVPNLNLNPNEDEARAARNSVLAYYQVPPPSPPPTGPLPAPPQPVPSSASGSASPRQESEAQLLSPGRAFASRSPSPLGPGARYSRSPSPGMGVGVSQIVRRGRESPFPTRPVLPPQDSRQLVERVERYKALYATDGSDEHIQDEPGWERDQEIVDKHSSEYIREARARGEKRVYFDMNHIVVAEDDFPVDVDPIIPEIEVNPADGSVYEDFDEEADERLRYSELDEPSNIRELLREGVKDEFEDGEGDEASSRRSFAASSVYSRYSVLEADQSAQIRDGLVKRVAALYEHQDGRLLREDIPAVPKIPPELRSDGLGSGVRAAGQLGRTDLKVTSSPYRF